MSDYFYSSSRNGFYIGVLREVYERSDNGWPDDSVKITEDVYKYLIEGQSENKVITPDENGNPVLSDAPSLTQDKAIFGS